MYRKQIEGLVYFSDSSVGSENVYIRWKKKIHLKSFIARIPFPTILFLEN